MSVLTYNDLQWQIMRLIDGEDAHSSSIPIASMQQIIALGERRVYREIRSRFNEKAWGLSVTSNAVTLPNDFIASSIAHFGKKPLEPVTEEFLLERNLINSGGDCKYFARAGNTLIFSPAVADGTVLQGRYYCSLPALTNITLPANALMAENEDLYIYAALCESAPFFGEDARVPLWNSKYTMIRDEINTMTERSAYSSGRMQRKPSTRLIG